MIDIIDPVYAKITDKSLYDTVWEILSYQSISMVPGKFAAEKKLEQKSFLDKRNGRFLSGFVPRVVKELKRLKLMTDEQEQLLDLKYNLIFDSPKLPGLTLREDQLDLLARLPEEQRGIMKAPTGSGKTVVAAAIMSMLPEANYLFLCHTRDLLYQSIDEFKKFGLNVLQYGDGCKQLPPEIPAGTVVVSTVQSWSREITHMVRYSDRLDVVIVDECHHVSEKNDQYRKALQHCLAPIRVGLTATLPGDQVALFTLEGHIGPVIGELTLDEGISKGILAEPEIHWISVPVEDNLLKWDKYKDIYPHCVVNNRNRNRLIMTEALYEVSRGNSVLILVKEIQHGNNLLEMADIFDIDADFVSGNSNKDYRATTKRRLEAKETMCVIATTTWKEGINIKSLGCVINAAGGKSEISILQAIGRGMRTTETKSSVIIKDFVDGYKYLSHHVAMRLRIYAENKWAMRGIK